MSGRVFVYGSINTDLVMYVARLPLPGETVSGGAFASYPGGKGANQAVAAALAGRDVAVEDSAVAVELFGCVGDDALGRERLASLSATRVSTRGVRVAAGIHSGIVQVMVDAEGENTMAVAPGANMKFSAEGVEVTRPPRGEVWVSMFQNEVPREATEALIVKAHEAGHLVIWNIAPHWRLSTISCATETSCSPSRRNGRRRGGRSRASRPPKTRTSHSRVSPSRGVCETSS
jgi:ribokinase